jgi:hypothetical protein
MKKLFEIHILTYLLATSLAITQISCSSTENKQAYHDGETAYNDFRNYVTTVENATIADSVDLQTASTMSRQEYDAKVASLDQYSSEYDEARRQEIEDLKGRYNTYWDKQVAQYNAQATSRHGGLAPGFNTEGLSSIPATSIRLAYEGLIAQIQANKDSYTHQDWKAINDYYLALDERKNAVQSELSDKDKYEIGKAKAKYVALRTAARFDPDVSEAASDVGDAAGKAGRKIDTTAEKVGAEIKHGAKTGAKKAGHAAEKTGREIDEKAEKVGSEVKSTTKKAANKVDSKIDDDPEIRE